jgi:hypothetical protein
MQLAGRVGFFKKLQFYQSIAINKSLEGGIVIKVKMIF